jgi:hypothetical protein
MSFSVTKDQMYEHRKSVTRRLGWWFLRPGDVVMAVEKAMGLKKGERMKKIYPIEIVSVRTERLADIKQDDLALEGFPEMTTSEFVKMFCALHKGKGCTPETLVNRVEFRPVEPNSKKVS